MQVAEIRTSAGRVRYVVVDGAGNLVDSVVRFLKHLDDRGYARNTLRAYGHSLALFFRYLGEHALTYDAVGVQELGAFVFWLKLPISRRDLAPLGRRRQARTDRTINAHLAALAAFYDYLWRTEAMDRNLNERLRGSGRHRPFKRFLQHLGPQLNEQCTPAARTTPRGTAYTGPGPGERAGNCVPDSARPATGATPV